LSQDQKRSIFSVAIAILFYFKKELVIKKYSVSSKGAGEQKCTILVGKTNF
jgi:hypothetical protein